MNSEFKEKLSKKQDALFSKSAYHSNLAVSFWDDGGHWQHSAQELLREIEEEMEDLFEIQFNESGAKMASATKKINKLGNLRREVMIELSFDSSTIPDAIGMVVQL